MFWSIKFVYHRHKRAIFQHKQHKKKDRTIQLYRGSSIHEKEAKQLAMNVGTYIEAEGFLSTSLDSKAL
jgi:primosomal replication protein N